MFQKSVLSATYICSLQIPGNRLIQTPLVDCESIACVRTRGAWRIAEWLWGTGDSRNHPPVHSKKSKICLSTTLQNVEEKLYQTQAQGGWARKACPPAEDAPSQRARGGTQRNLQVTFLQGWSTRALPLQAASPPCEEWQLCIKQFPLLLVWEKWDPNIFELDRLFLSPSSHWGILALRLWNTDRWAHINELWLLLLVPLPCTDTQLTAQLGCSSCRFLGNHHANYSFFLPLETLPKSPNQTPQWCEQEAWRQVLCHAPECTEGNLRLKEVHFTNELWLSVCGSLMGKYSACGSLEELVCAGRIKITLALRTCCPAKQNWIRKATLKHLLFVNRGKTSQLKKTKTF